MVLLIKGLDDPFFNVKFMNRTRQPAAALRLSAKENRLRTGLEPV